MRRHLLLSPPMPAGRHPRDPQGPLLMLPGLLRARGVLGAGAQRVLSFHGGSAPLTDQTAHQQCLLLRFERA